MPRPSLANLWEYLNKFYQEFVVQIDTKDTKELLSILLGMIMALRLCEKMTIIFIATQ